MDPQETSGPKNVFNCAKKLMKSENKEKGRSSLACVGGEQSFLLGSPNNSSHSQTFDENLSSFSDNSKPSENSSNSNSKPEQNQEELCDLSSLAENRICKCKSCRTAVLTSLGSQSSQVALRCYYCSTGILVSSGEDEDKSDKVSFLPSSATPSSPAFTCIDCGQHFPSGLPFILRLVTELSMDIAYWAADWQSKRVLLELAGKEKENSWEVVAANAVLESWRKAHQQLGKMLPTDSLRLVQSALKLAEACRATEGESSQAAAVELLMALSKTLLGDAYEPLESVVEKGALMQVLNSAKKIFEEVDSAFKESSSDALESVDLGSDPVLAFEVAENEVAKGLKEKIEQLEVLMLLEQKIENPISGLVVEK